MGLSIICVCIAVVLISSRRKNPSADGPVAPSDRGDHETRVVREQSHAKADDSALCEEGVKEPSEPPMSLCCSVRDLLASFDVDPIRGENADCFGLNSTELSPCNLNL